MATISSDFELDENDSKLAEHIAEHIRNLLASGLHVSVTIEATQGAPQKSWSSTTFHQLVKLFVTANESAEGKVHLRERIEVAIGVSVRTFARWESGQCSKYTGSAMRDFLTFILHPHQGFTVTDDMRALATSLSS